MNALRFALREIIHRRGYSGLFVLSVGVGAAVLMALASFSSAVERAITDQARELWAADITVEGSEPLLNKAEPWIRSRWPGSSSSRTTDTISMVRHPTTGRVAQATLSALTDNYPLYGRIEIRSGRPLHSVLKPGEAVVGEKLLRQLDVSVGDKFQVGNLTLTVADVIASRTDSPTSFFEFAPSVFVTPEDLSASGLIAPGSRARNTLYVNFPAGQDLARAMREIKQHVAGETNDVSSWTTDNPGILKFIKRTLLFLKFLGLLTLTLGGVGVAGTLSAALNASTRSMGMVFALGAPRAFVLRIWLWWVAILTSAGMFLALLLGKGVAELLIAVFGDLLPPQLSLGFPVRALLQAASAGFGASLLFAILPLMKLMDIPPNAILAEEVPVFPRRWTRSFFVLLGSAAVFYLIVLSQVGRPLMALNYLGGLVGVLGASWLLATAALWLVRRLFLARSSPTLRLSARGLSRPGNLNQAVVVSLAVTLATLMSLFLLEKNLTAQFVESFPENMPNVFFINIQKDQVGRFKEILGQPDARLFPLIRGRVVAVNGGPVRSVQKRSESKHGEGDRLTREFGFTFGEDILPTDSVVGGGSLWDENVQGPQVSVFDEYHTRFGIDIGDVITVNILGMKIDATVTSLRSINQSVRQPFFYFYFKPGAIDAAPYTLMGGVHVAPGSLSGVEMELAERMPNVTTIDLTEVAALTGKIIQRLTRIVNTLGLFGVASGLLLLVSNLWTTLMSRTRESVLYRTLGASTGQVTRIYILEYAWIAAMAGLAAFLVGNISVWIILKTAFELKFEPYAPFSVSLLTGLGLGMVGLSWLASRSAFRSSPMEVLRHE